MTGLRRALVRLSLLMRRATGTMLPIEPRFIGGRWRRRGALCARRPGFDAGLAIDDEASGSSAVKHASAIARRNERARET